MVKTEGERLILVVEDEKRKKERLRITRSYLKKVLRAPVDEDGHTHGRRKHYDNRGNAEVH